jgi:tetratricopeptide (TPR) repeat protein
MVPMKSLVLEPLSNCTPFSARAVPLLFALFLGVAIVSLRAAAQAIPADATASSSQAGGRDARVRSNVGLSTDPSVLVRVSGPHQVPFNEQAFVRLYRIDSGKQLRSGLTNADGSISFSSLPGSGSYAVDVAAAGYRSQRKRFSIPDANSSFAEVDVTLEPAPSSSEAPGAPRAALPKRVRTHVDKGLAAFRAGNLKEAQKELAAAYSAAPGSALANYLLGVLYAQTHDLDQAERYFADAVSIDPSDIRSFLGLAHVRYAKRDLKGSANALQRAIALDPKQWEALWLLAQIHLQQRDFAKAQQEAESALEFGKGKANGARFIKGEALAELGRTDDAIKALQAFLRDAPTDPNAPLARELAGKLELAPPQQQAPGTFVIHMAPATRTRLEALPKATDASPALAVSNPVLPLPDWEPVGVDQEKPALADGVVCPAAEVIEKAGRRVSELVDSVNRIEATENITHEELSVLGRPVSIEKRKFDYFISITDSSGLLDVTEDREGSDGGAFMDHVSMFGLADLPLVFHPSLRRDFRMTCEGLGRWQGRATWLVYFSQRPDRPEQIRSYQLLDGSSYNAGLKGRAWIAADTYELVRIEADLIKAIPQIGLGSEEDVIEYSPVPFHTGNLVLWLPASADIYYFYKHRPFHRHHAFTDYRLFSVSTSEKLGQPAAEQKNNRP